ncbi:DUF2959 domain-containing protein [Desulfuromonas versatilis]|uniref:DUF2959 domain-containing protein n=1 Tax=Desulfuromonas versatilis TaxID=2802975 RepID=A0ABN6DWD0_9BACT|nr:DUF2959 domain-containing protein [Desulfuromonas versatilis]BCR04438.1 DUF2959 domain-containing protein [Desulfuromonas versatilis]
MNLRRFQAPARILAWLLSLTFLTGCQTAYYHTMEKFGVHKRDILVDRVEEARDSQQEAKEQFRSALQRFNEVLGVQSGALEEQYNKLKAELDRSEAKADAVRSRIDDVEDVAGALFDEWKDELEQYSNASLRRDSQAKLERTRRQYGQLIGAMKRAEERIDPVLSAFRDQVLYLKHNLNAQAIASLKGELKSIEGDIGSLIREMERSISEADSFISAMARD